MTPTTPTSAPGVSVEATKLWLWKNFVDGKPEYWAFDNPFPINLNDGDPQTLGEPCGYAVFKPSRQGRTDVSEEQVLRDIASARPNPPTERDGLTSKEAWWAGYREGRGLPPDTPRHLCVSSPGTPSAGASGSDWGSATGHPAIEESISATPAPSVPLGGGEASAKESWLGKWTRVINEGNPLQAQDAAPVEAELPDWRILKMHGGRLALMSPGGDRFYFIDEIDSDTPAGVQGDAAREPNWLCYAWGESDYPIAELAVTRDDVIRFLCEFWFGCSVENYPKDEDAVSAVAEFDAPEWDEGDTLTWKFEIGGVQITRLSAAAAQASGS